MPLAVGLLVTPSALGCGGGETVGTAPTTIPPSTTFQSTGTSAPEPPITTTTVTELAIDPDGVRYLDLVFENIETVSEVVYWPDAPPLAEGDAPVADLTMGLYLPAGDTLTERPVIVAFAAFGASGAGILSLALAWGQSNSPEVTDAGEPPVIMFNGIRDTTYPFEAVEQNCPAAQAVGELSRVDRPHCSAPNPLSPWRPAG